MNSHVIALSVTLSATLLTLPGTLLGQVPLEQTPSKGLELPDRSIGLTQGIQGVEQNPASLSFMNGFEGMYALQWAMPDFERTVPAGHALFVGAGTPGFGIGFGAQWLFQPGIGGPDIGDDYRKYTVALSLGTGEMLSFGLNYNFFGSDTSKALDELGGWDAGFQLRFSPYFAVGGIARDINAPFLGETSLPRRWSIAPAFRLWDGRVQVEQMLHYTEDRAVIDLEPRISLEVYQGIQLFGRSLIRLGTDNATSDRTGLKTISAGAQISLANAGTASAMHLRDVDGLQIASNTHSLWFSSDPKRGIFSPDKRWVLVDFTSPFTDLPIGGLFGSDAPSFLKLMLALERLEKDPTVDGIVFNIAGPGLGWSQIWEVRDMLRRFKAKGKQTLAILQTANTKSIMLGSGAQKVWMMPNVVYDPDGITSTIINFKEGLSKLGVKAEFLRIRDYKSFPEMYFRNSPSKESLTQTTDYVTTFYTSVVDAIATGRNKTPQEVKAMVDGGPLLPDEALKQGYVDKLIYSDEFEDAIKAHAGPDVYITRSVDLAKTQEDRWRSPSSEIAVIVVSGSIVQGKSGGSPIGGSMAGSQTLIQTIGQLRTNDSVKAVVLRVDSPGGSAVASDQIYRELRRLAKVKPVITSMSRTAASGGYYIAAGGDEIFATPLTITGSIGIFTGKFSLEGLAKWLGVHSTQVRAGKGGDSFSLWKPFTQTQRQALTREITYLYQLFLHQIAQTRPLSADQIDKLGRGRVWTGEAAVSHKLVDKEGSLIDAIDRAKELTKIDPKAPVQVSIYPEPGNSLALLANLVSVVTPEESTQDLEQINELLHKLMGQVPASLTRLLLFNSGEALMLPDYGIEGLD